jgi:hypothetical protein
MSIPYLPATLRDPRAHRARACLLYLLNHPGASNKDISRGIGIARHEQMSKLLTRLHGLDLISKEQGRPGYPNAWRLTRYGEQVTGALEAEQRADALKERSESHRGSVASAGECTS